MLVMSLSVGVCDAALHTLSTWRRISPVLCGFDDYVSVCLLFFAVTVCFRLQPTSCGSSRRTATPRTRQSFTRPTSTSCWEFSSRCAGTSGSCATWSDARSPTRQDFHFSPFLMFSTSHRHRRLSPLPIKQAALNFTKFCEPLSEGKGEERRQGFFCVCVCV